MNRAPLALTLAASLSLVSCASQPRVEEPARMSAVEMSTMREDALALLLEAAASENPQMRANAIEALSAAPSRAADAARAGLVDDNLAVRYVSAMTCAELRDRSLRPAVEALLDDPSPVVRAAAIGASIRLGGNADPSPLGQLLMGSGDPRKRAQAAFILGEIGDPSALPMLRDAARRSPQTATLAELRLLRLQIAEAMAKLGDPTAIATVRAALYPSRPEELEAAALAVQILGEINDRRSVDQLIYLIERSGVDRMPAEVRLAAAAALAKLGERGGGFVADEYADSDQDVLRAQAAAVYGELGGPENAGKVRGLMDDPDPLVRVAAAAAALRLAR